MCILTERVLKSAFVLSEDKNMHTFKNNMILIIVSIQCLAQLTICFEHFTHLFSDPPLCKRNLPNDRLSGAGPSHFKQAIFIQVHAPCRLSSINFDLLQKQAREDAGGGQI